MTVRRTFKFDFPGLRIGTAEYPDGPTGCTVLHFPDGALGAIDVRGGAAATRESTILDHHSDNAWVDAITLAGGSTYGLEAASGVAAQILALRNGNTSFQNIPSVPAAVVYDFSIRRNPIYPDKALGARAFEAAVENEIEIGPAGAGSAVRVGKYLGKEWGEASGQGAAFVKVAGIRILVVSVVNALGNILDRGGKIVSGSKDPSTGARMSIAEALLARDGLPTPGESAPKNTTLTVIITDAKLGREELRRIGTMAHAALGRVIEPFHTPFDGDVLFTLSTNRQKLPESLTAMDLGTVAGQVAQDAVLSVFSGR